MRFKYILNSLSWMMVLYGGLIFVPCFVALYYREWSAIMPFAGVALVTVAVGLILRKYTEEYQNLNNVKKTEALFIVSATWFLLTIISAIPFVFFGLSPINAFFEAASGTSTTGASILTDYTIYPKTFFFWRSFTQWIGGMGIIVLFVAILPQFKVAGRQMFFAEAPGPTDEKITPRIRHTATALWGVYIFLTIIEVIALMAFGMPGFDAVCNSFSTLSGGGFSPNGLSIMGYNNSAFVWIISFFLFLASANFALQYKVLTKFKLRYLWESEEFRLLCKIVLFLSVSIALFLHFYDGYSVNTSIRDAIFQVCSLISTAGFASVDFNNWCVGAKVLLFTTIFVGGCAGSAAGGIKVVRVLFGFKYLKRELVQIVHPRAVLPIKIDKKPLSHDVLRQILGFLIFYFVIAIFSCIITSIIEENIIVGITGTFTTLGNAGPGYGPIGPMGNFDSLSSVTKFIFSMNMIIGRLELIPFLAMLYPDFWTRSSGYEAK